MLHQLWMRMIQSRKSTHSRQKQYFEQRKRHQHATRSANLADDGPNKGFNNHEAPHSLDVLSLNNLAATQHFCVDKDEDEISNVKAMKSFPEFPLNEDMTASSDLLKGTKIALSKEKIRAPEDSIDFPLNKPVAEKSPCTEKGSSNLSVSAVVVQDSPCFRSGCSYFNKSHYKLDEPKIPSFSDPCNTSKNHARADGLKRVLENQVSLLELLNDDQSHSNLEGPLSGETHVAFSVKGLGKVTMETPPRSPEQVDRYSEIIREKKSTYNGQEFKGNELFYDVGKMVINLKYRDPTYMVHTTLSEISSKIICSCVSCFAIFFNSFHSPTVMASGWMCSSQNLPDDLRLNLGSEDDICFSTVDSSLELVNDLPTLKDYLLNADGLLGGKGSMVLCADAYQAQDGIFPRKEASHNVGSKMEARMQGRFGRFEDLFDDRKCDTSCDEKPLYNDYKFSEIKNSAAYVCSFEDTPLQNRRSAEETQKIFDIPDVPNAYFMQSTSKADYDFVNFDLERYLGVDRGARLKSKRPAWSFSITDDAPDDINLHSEESCSSTAGYSI